MSQRTNDYLLKLWTRGEWRHSVPFFSSSFSQHGIKLRGLSLLGTKQDNTAQQIQYVYLSEWVYVCLFHSPIQLAHLQAKWPVCWVCIRNKTKTSYWKFQQILFFQVGASHLCVHVHHRMCFFYARCSYTMHICCNGNNMPEEEETTTKKQTESIRNGTQRKGKITQHKIFIQQLHVCFLNRPIFARFFFHYFVMIFFFFFSYHFL